MGRYYPTMLRQLIVLLLLGLSFVPGTAVAQLDLRWENCTEATPEEPAPRDNVNLDCTSRRDYALFGTLRLPFSMSNVRGVVFSLDVYDENAPGLSPFWQFQPARDGFPRGCNNALGLSVNHRRSRTSVCSAVRSPWDDEDFATGTSVDYRLGFPPSNRGHFVGSVHSFDHPIEFESGAAYYVFDLRIPTRGALSCRGCNDVVTIALSTFEIERMDGSSVRFSSQALPSACVTVNGPGRITCAATAVRSRTWGAIKTLYR